MEIAARTRHWHRPTPDEEALMKNPEDRSILYILLGLSPDEVKEIGRSFVIKSEYYDHAQSFRIPWLDAHKYLVGISLAKAEKEGRSHKDINLLLAEEYLSGKGQNVCFDIFYAAKFSDHIELVEGEDPFGLEAFLDEVRCARRILSSGQLPV